MAEKKHIFINVIHAKTGGGLVVLNHVLPFLAKESSFKVTVLAAKGYEDHIVLPKTVNLLVKDVPQGLLKMLLWEQFIVPKIAKKYKADITLNMASYAPILAPSPVIYISNNPEVRHFVSFKEKLYWWALIWMTRLSVLFSPLSFSNGAYVQSLYARGVFSFLKKRLVCCDNGL